MTPHLSNAKANKEVVKHNETVTYACDDGFESDDILAFTCADGVVDTGNAECKSKRKKLCFVINFNAIIKYYHICFIIFNSVKLIFV